MKKMKKRAITLIEIMIVISLIAIIGGVLSYNLTGALDKGKAFRTEQAQNQICEALQLVYSEKSDTVSWQEIVQNPLEFLEDIQIVKKPKDLLKDGWGVEMKIDYDPEIGEFSVFSEKLDKYNHKNDDRKKS